jgi:hypothetical protein
MSEDHTGIALSKKKDIFFNSFYKIEWEEDKIVEKKLSNKKMSIIIT